MKEIASPPPIRSVFRTSGTYSAPVFCCSRFRSAPVPEAGTRTRKIYILYDSDHVRRWAYTNCIIVTPVVF